MPNLRKFFIFAQISKKNPVDAQINDLTLFYGDLRQSEKLFKINLPLRLLSMVKITYLMITKTEFQICLWALETLRIMIIKMVLSTWRIEIFQVKIWSKSKTINFLSARGSFTNYVDKILPNLNSLAPSSRQLWTFSLHITYHLLTWLSLDFWPPTYLFLSM